MFQSDERVTKTIYKDFDLGFFSSSKFTDLSKSFNHIEHRAGEVGREGLGSTF